MIPASFTTVRTDPLTCKQPKIIKKASEIR